MSLRPIGLLSAILILPGLAAADEPAPNRPKVPGKMRLNLRERQEDKANGGVKAVQRAIDWDVNETAVIICDMWDDHYCKLAAQRVAAMAPKMNQVLTAARDHGVQIIHAPSDTIYIYAGTPHRRRMQEAKLFKSSIPIAACVRDPDKEPELPVDTSKCACDDPVVGPYVRRFSRQHPSLDIIGYDGVSDSGVEIYNFFRQEGIKNVALMGVHTNMCVLGRSFGIRQMVKLGMNVVLVRDMTDALYDPRQPPYVSHARGTEMIIEHIERYWCPSIASEDLTRVVPATAGPFPSNSKTAAKSALSLRAALADKPKAVSNPFYAMDTCTKRPYPKNDIAPAAQLDMLKELGYAGIAWTEEPPDQVKAVAAEASKRGLKVFAIYCSAQVTADGDLKYSAKLPDIMTALKGHEAIVWLHIGGKGPAFDKLTGQAPVVNKLRFLADAAAAHGLRIAVYPHVGEWTARFGDATALAKAVNHPRFGVTFNLCHCLAMGDEKRIPELLDDAKSLLFTVTINGADSGLDRPDFTRLIQTLDKGSYDAGIVLRKLRQMGYPGAIGLQGYGLGGDRRKNLAVSMDAWKKLSAAAGK